MKRVIIIGAAVCVAVFVTQVIVALAAMAALAVAASKDREDP